MRVAVVDGLVTLFYDGSKPLYNGKLKWEWRIEHGRWCQDNWTDHKNWKEHWEEWNISDECKKYWKERISWQQIIVQEGVTEIPEDTFSDCENIKRVIFANTVIRIKNSAFSDCVNLTFVKLPVNLEFIGNLAFYGCNLSSIFIPPRCREIGDLSFEGNANLTILNVPRNAYLGYSILEDTKLEEKSPFCRSCTNRESISNWLKNVNNGHRFDLHRVCSSFEPTLDMILDTMQTLGGLKAFKVENDFGITPSRYLKENPYANVTEKEIIEKYVLRMMKEL